MAEASSEVVRGAPTSKSSPSEQYDPRVDVRPSPSRSARSQASTMAQTDLEGQAITPRGSATSLKQSSSDLYGPQPVRNAVTSASTAAFGSQVSPDLVAQITEQVLQTLRNSGLSESGSPPSPKVSNSYPPPSTTDSASSMPPRSVYTPPSPDQDEEDGLRHSPRSYHGQQPEVDGVSDPSKPFVASGSPSKPSTDANTTRPRMAARAPTDDRTTLEKHWQPLFDANGMPTPRVSQFLRGLAVHIIEDYEPQRSLVITPQKMMRFYEATRLSNEIYPWGVLFGEKLSGSSLSHVYRDLQCQHHFIQDKHDDKPSIPALTPKGFERWMVLMIQAHPDLEYSRLAKAVLNMPISNADNPKERFPKELSRRLLPKQPVETVMFEVQDTILRRPSIEEASLRAASPVMTAPRQPSPSGRPAPVNMPIVPPPASMPPPPPANARERSMDSMEDSIPGSVPIERQRKPYAAQPGGGKVYSEDAPPVPSSYSEGIQQQQQYHQHRYSTSNLQTRPHLDPNDELSGGRTSRYRAGSANSSQQPPTSAFRRNDRSPSQNGRERLDPNMPPLSQFPTAPPSAFDGVDEGQVRYSRDERLRRYTTDERYRPPPPGQQQVPPPPPPPVVGSPPKNYAPQPAGYQPPAGAGRYPETWDRR